MQQITIIGLGLIGGSIGLALKRWSAENDNALKVVGFDTNIEHQQIAKQKKAVDDTIWSLPDAVSEADVVIIATPVGTIQQLFEDIGEHLKFNAIVTDTGSTKADVLEWAKVLPSHVSFVGGHPMAGRSESIEAADADLFEGATWIVCPSPTASEIAIKNVMGLIAATRAEPYFVEPAEHDAYVAGISHLPFIVAATLVKATNSDQSWRDMKTLASSGFRDTTRLALGSPEMHRDITLTNRASISRWIDQLVESLQDFNERLRTEDDEELEKSLLEYFREAQDLRAAAESVKPRSSEMAIDDAQSNTGSVMRNMLFGGFGRKKDDKNKR